MKRYRFGTKADNGNKLSSSPAQYNRKYSAVEGMAADALQKGSKKFDFVDMSLDHGIVKRYRMTYNGNMATQARYRWDKTQVALNGSVLK